MIQSGKITMLACLIFCLPAIGQNDYPYKIKQYPFIQYDKNVVYMPKDSTAFLRFFNKWDKLMLKGKGQINIIHFGGSHIQADIVSNQIRWRLSKLNPGNKGARGLVFPYDVAHTNNPWNYMVDYSGDWESCKITERNPECPLGVTGITITTTDANAVISLALRQNWRPVYDFNICRVYHKVSNESFSIFPADIDTTMYTTIINKKIGYTEFQFNKYLTEITFKFQQKTGDEKFFQLYGIQLENKDPGITYHAIGINGAGTYSYLECSQLLEKQLSAIAPDLIIFNIGVNDAYGSSFSKKYFEMRYTELINRMRTVVPKAAILFITNNDTWFNAQRGRGQVNTNNLQAREAMFNLGKNLNCAVWDMFEVMGGLKSMALWEANDLAQRDRVHFKSEGYRLAGDLFFNALLKSYENHIAVKNKTSLNSNN